MIVRHLVEGALFLDDASGFANKCFDVQYGMMRRAVLDDITNYITRRGLSSMAFATSVNVGRNRLPEVDWKDRLLYLVDRTLWNSKYAMERMHVKSFKGIGNSQIGRLRFFGLCI